MHKQNRYIVANTYKSNPYLQYFNQFKEIKTQPKALSDLSDGVFLIQLVQIIKDFSLKGDIFDTPKSFSHRLSNFKSIFKGIQNFWNINFGSEIEGEQIDLVQICKTSNIQQIGRMLQLIIKTAIQAQNKDYFIEKVLTTSRQTQQFLKKIIEQVFNTDRQSPRKQKEKRMYDKILQLDHQNDKLLAVIQEICDEKLEFQQKIKILTDQLAIKTAELQQFESLMQQDAFTPQKKKLMMIPDTSDRKDSLIQSLKLQISQISVAHQKQLQNCYSQMEKMRVKNAEYQRMKNQFVLSREIAESHKQLAAQLESDLSLLKADNMSKQNHIEIMKDKLEKSNRIIVELQTSLTNFKAQSQRKNIQITQLITKLEDIEKRISPRKPNGSLNNLFADIPDIVNTEAEAYMETNRSLREELERSRKKLQQSQNQIQRLSSQLENLRGCDIENRKLRQMIIQYNTYRGQENQILVNTLYHLRKLIKTKKY